MIKGRNIPNLFIVGAPKCGTTAWIWYLSGHPEVYFSPVEEPHYFCTDFPKFRWSMTEEQYEALFSPTSGEKIIAEASVQYLYSREAAKNISAYNPDAKILIFLRDQASFLPSYHNQLLYNRDETIADFETAWRLAAAGKRRGIPASCREPAFLDYPEVGRFSEQIGRYLEHFPREQVRVTRFEEWTRDPRATYVELIRFLGLADDGRTEFAPVNEAKHHRSGVLATITQRPPTWLLRLSGLVKATTGRERLGAAKLLRRLNRGRGYKAAPPPGLREEIQAFFADDNDATRELLLHGAPSGGERNAAMSE